MRKNYWKELSLLLIGSLIGNVYANHTDSLLIRKDIINNDTIVLRDTVIKEVLKTESKKTSIPPLNKESVLDELKRQNIPHANIVLAQSILETGNYKSKLTRTHNNIFGIRSGNKYKKYDNYVECITDYKKRISSRYKGGDYYSFLRRIKYATDATYVDKLKKIV